MMTPMVVFAEGSRAGVRRAGEQMPVTVEPTDLGDPRRRSPEVVGV